MGTCSLLLSFSATALEKGLSAVIGTRDLACAGTIKFALDAIVALLPESTSSNDLRGEINLVGIFIFFAIFLLFFYLFQ